MNKLEKLYQEAGDNNLNIHNFAMKGTLSMAFTSNDIALDVHKIKNKPKKIICLAHEMGHCFTGNFYNVKCKLDIRQKRENKADKWAIKKLIPKDELKNAVKSDLWEVWELAEYFEVTNELITKAIAYYNITNYHNILKIK